MFAGKNPHTCRQKHYVFYSVSNIFTKSFGLFFTMMVIFKLQCQYKQRNRQNKHRDYRRFSPFTKSFDKFKRGSPALTNTHFIWILKAF
jgi:hypothetical protein